MLDTPAAHAACERECCTLPGETLVFTRDLRDACAADALRTAGADVVACRRSMQRDASICRSVLQELGRRECNDVLVEAGPTLAGGFCSRLVDELVLYVAPMLLGAQARSHGDAASARSRSSRRPAFDATKPAAHRRRCAASPCGGPPIDLTAHVHGIVQAIGEAALAARRVAATSSCVSLRRRSGSTASRSATASAWSGCCLTVTRLHGEEFAADVSVETLRVTTLGELASRGARQSREGAARRRQPLGGH